MGGSQFQEEPEVMVNRVHANSSFENLVAHYKSDVDRMKFH